MYNELTMHKIDPYIYINLPFCPPPSGYFSNYSSRKLLTGFANAALMV